MSVEAIPRAVELDPRWYLAALCAEVSGDLWHAEKGASDDVRITKAICRRCSVQRECLADALAYEALPGKVRIGVRAGTTPRDREAIVRGRRTA